MTRLSIPSVDFIKQCRRGHMNIEDPSWHQAYARLFCEMYDIIRHTKVFLDDMALGKWSISYDGHDQDGLSFSFQLEEIKKIQGARIVIKIQPLKTSYIEAYSPSDMPTRQLSSFNSSPAYRRYFSKESNGNHHIKTVIPQAQITSRYFGDYVNHLITMMRPFLQAMSMKQLQAA